MFLVGQLSRLVENFDTKIFFFSDTINLIHVTLCMMEIYLFIPPSVILTIFKGHNNVEQFKQKKKIWFSWNLIGLLSKSERWWIYHHFSRPRGLTFTWWGCFGLCFWHKPTELAYSFFFVYFCLYGPFHCISFHILSRQLSAFSLFSRSYFCLIGPLSYMSLNKSLLQPWYNPLWLTGLRAPTN